MTTDSYLPSSGPRPTAALSPDLWREACRFYGFPLVMFALAIVPVLNFSYSGHGGIAWLLAPLCFPYVLVRGVMKLKQSRGEDYLWYRTFLAISIPLYIALAFPLSWAATYSLRHTFGLTISAWKFAMIMISPIPFWYFT